MADCGPACLSMIASYFGKNYSLDYLRQMCYITREGVSLVSINDAAESLGFKTYMAHLDFETLIKDCPLPAILHWNQDHFVVLYKVVRNKYFVIGDPAHGIIKINKETFLRSYISTATDTGTALLLEPTPAFYSKETIKSGQSNYGFVYKYLKPFKRYLIQLILGMFLASFISLVFPYVTKFLIDEGIGKNNISVVYLVLLSQFFLFVGSTIIELLRNWLLLHINSRISLNIISDFLLKLLKLPISFFDSKAVGDLSQRIADHHRIDSFLTNTLISSVFSFISILVFSVILFFYSPSIFYTFFSLSVLGVIWIFIFQRRRKELDYRRFARNREYQDKLYEMIVGMQEIKLFGSETTKRWEWERLQIKFFKLNIKTLALEQWQQTGFNFFTSLKNILISFLAAKEVMEGNITLGTLLSISYIIGQTNGPITQLTNFFKSAQDAKLSMDRLEEIHLKKGEEEKASINKEIKEVGHEDIYFDDVSFQYEGPNSEFVLSNVSFCIPRNKVTAIVGVSGSGKTTLMKLLLGFYRPVNGKIWVGDTDLQELSMKMWRSICGTVMQDGYIFYDTIARNIAVDGKPIDERRMENAVEIASIRSFIEGLPLGYTTKIGASGVGISGGQKQRILIARAIYKNPQYLFFDEATSSLDANNEKLIINNLNDFFLGKTVVVIAHRLSTVKHADQIIVLDQGKIVEIGTHKDLSISKGRYFELVKNQLELGN